jgi:hypothetical protein
VCGCKQGLGVMEEGTMDSFYGIKLLNTLCVCMLLTDAALNRPHGTSA